MRRQAQTSGPVMRYEVRHPEYGQLEVNSLSPESAVWTAVRRWGADWRTEACNCTVKKLGTAAKPRCRRCGKEFGRPGDYTAFCPDCERVNELYQRELASRAKADRRAGMRK